MESLDDMRTRSVLGVYRMTCGLGVHLRSSDDTWTGSAFGVTGHTGWSLLGDMWTGSTCGHWAYWCLLDGTCTGSILEVTR